MSFARAQDKPALQARRVSTSRRLFLFLALLAATLFGLLCLFGFALGLGFGAFFAFHFLFALLDDFGLCRRRRFCRDCLGGLLFFNLQRDHVRDNLFRIGQQLHLSGVN